MAERRGSNSFVESERHIAHRQTHNYNEGSLHLQADVQKIPRIENS